MFHVNYDGFRHTSTMVAVIIFMLRSPLHNLLPVSPKYAMLHFHMKYYTLRYLGWLAEGFSFGLPARSSELQ